MLTDPETVEEFFNLTSLLFVLLNPFLMTIYLLDLIRSLDGRTFMRVLGRGALIATSAFLVFAFSGDRLFRNLLHVRFASFLIFGGILFLIIGVRFVVSGPHAISQLRGPPEHVAGSIAMPFMIGPATVSASMLTGARLPGWLAPLCIASAMLLVVVCVLVLKYLHDHVRARYEQLIERYVDIVGRVSALIIGTIAVDMILRGIELWQSSR